MRKLSVRLLAFNLMLLFLPLASLLYLDTYERQLLQTQEDSMIQQGRILASALAGENLASEAAAVLGRLGGRVDSRLRVVDSAGRLVADSAAMAGPGAGIARPGEAPEPSAAASRTAEAVDGIIGDKEANEQLLYRLVVWPLNVARRLFLPPRAEYAGAEYYSGADTLLGQEVLAALSGRYGAATRLSTGGQVSVTLYSAIPVFDGSGTGIAGAVLVSRSSYNILVKLYELRLDVIRIFMFSLAAALVLSLALSLTITVPIARLRAQAESVLDGAGRFRGRFTGLRRRDEIGDLSRALAALSEKLERRISYIDGFTADLMHELKNPLAAIRGAVELALSSPGREEGFLATIRDEERRMERLLAGLREISGIDNRLDGETVECVDLASLLPAILGRYPHRDHPAVSVAFRNGLGSPAPLAVSPDRLVQLVCNPVDNAVSFSPPGSTVEVALEGDAKRYRIVVSDSGPGLPDRAMERVFDRFYSDRPADAAGPTGKDGGAGGATGDHSGLGLSIAKAIAEGYGGSCSISNRPEGGCRFEAILPRR